MDADSSFVVTKVVPALSVSCGPVQEWALVALWTEACCLVVLGTVDVRTIVEGAVTTANGPATPLVHEVPVEAGVGSMLRTFVLYKEWALLRTELLQVPVERDCVEQAGSRGLPSRKSVKAPEGPALGCQ